MFGNFFGRFFGNFFGFITDGEVVEPPVDNSDLDALNLGGLVDISHNDIVYLGRQNAIQKGLKDLEGAWVDPPYPLDADNKLVLQLLDRDRTETEFNSVDDAALFSTSDTVKIGGEVVRPIQLILGDAGLAEGEYDAVLTAFTDDYPEGLAVGEFRIQVREA